MSSRLLFAAIDFGTTYSGWAFCLNNELEKESPNIQVKNWIGGDHISEKTSTCLLIKPNGRTFDSFGYEAESKYAELSTENKHREWYFFKRFKMSLFHKLELARNLMIEDFTGKKLPARTVFAMSIEYLKKDLMEAACKGIADPIYSHEIQWTLTVPAIWTDAAKQMMREAAVQAGIPGDNLIICLEPEAASLFVRHVPVEKDVLQKRTGLAKFHAGTKYIVLDAGGGTVDINVHEVLDDGNLRELHMATGGDWGGTKVDAAFETFLNDILGKRVLDAFKANNMDDYLELLRSFEIKKTSCSMKKSALVVVHIPLSLFELAKTIAGLTVEECINQSKFKGAVSVFKDKIKINADVMHSFFENSIKQIVECVGRLLRERFVSKCEAIVMVGGFSESPLLQENIQDAFNGRLKIIIPDGAGLAVLKGAVIYGHNSKYIAERIIKLTYGENLSHPTSDRCNHPKGKQGRDENGIMKCWELFNVHAKIGQSVKIGDECKEQISCPTYDDQDAVDVEIYVSSAEKPYFVTDPGCKKIGHFSVPIPDKTLGKERKFGVSFIFGGTEIKVKVADKITGETTIKYMDFLG